MRVIQSGVMPDGTSVQIEDWHNDYSFHRPCDTIAAYPKSKISLPGAFAPKGNVEFRASFRFENEELAQSAFNRLIAGTDSLAQYVHLLDNPSYAECLIGVANACKVLETRGSYQLCYYPAGFYTVDMNTKSIGRTVKAGTDKDEIKAYFDQIGEANGIHN